MEVIMIRAQYKGLFFKILIIHLHFRLANKTPSTILEEGLIAIDPSYFISNPTEDSNIQKYFQKSKTIVWKQTSLK
jgi:hypothetical protein